MATAQLKEGHLVLTGLDHSGNTVEISGRVKDVRLGLDVEYIPTPKKIKVTLTGSSSVEERISIKVTPPSLASAFSPTPPVAVEVEVVHTAKIKIDKLTEHEIERARDVAGVDKDTEFTVAYVGIDTIYVTFRWKD